MGRRPGYLSQYLKQGEYTRCAGGEWYATRKTSKRIPGEKYPVVVCEDVAIITPSGRIELSSLITPTIEDVEVCELGFSYILQHIIPIKWKKVMKADADEIFLHAVAGVSSDSYLLRNRELSDLSHRNPKGEVSKFWKYMPEDIQETLKPMKSLHVFYYPDNRVVLPKPTPEHLRILSQYDIAVEDIRI